ncbi:MAG: transcription-repair coupling factor [Clostridia bacterium]|nr:transcription-repair coupling factor [Clostridia bacterium]
MLPQKLSLDRLGRGYLNLKEALKRGEDSIVFYSAQNARYHLASQAGRFFLYVTPDRLQAKSAVEILNDYLGEEVVLIPEKDDLLINATVNLSGSVAERTLALTKILCGKARGAVVSVEGLMQYFPDPAVFASSVIEISVGAEVDVNELADRLAEGGYTLADAVLEQGEFSRRGDVFDVWAVGYELPVRLEFFGDEVESMRFFAPDSMLSVREANEVIISPKSDIIVTQNGAKQAISKLNSLRKKSRRKLADVIDSVITKLELNPSDPSLIWAIPYLKGELKSLIDYLPDDAVICIDEPKTVDDKIKLLRNAHSSRVKSFTEADEATLDHLESLQTKEELYSCLAKRTLLGFQQITSSNPIFEPKAVFNLKSLAIPKYSTNFAALANDVRAMTIGGAQVIIYAGDEGACKTLKEFFNDNEIAVHITEDTEDDYPVLLIPDRVSRGFNVPSAHIMIIGTDDVIKKTEVRRKSASRKRAAFVMPEKGDYVVHEKHGIGLSEGLVTLTTTQGVKDYFCILYRGGDKLYLPVDKMDEVDKYTGGGTPALHKIGGKEFDRVKERVKTSVKAMAIDLVALYEKRLKAKGYKYSPDTVWQKEMEEAFPYEETDDQLIAISEVKEDMEKGRIMDRLICGDVGFGKTEVAIRAIFKTIIEGKQAAFLSPTTILCQQHYNTLLERFKPFGIKIDMLSRFVSQSDIKSALKRIESGETSVIVATHRILAKDVVFHDLGLLVLDEEQRFGVEHKEKIKVLKNDINVLSLSATPIPRTLHMAMSGIRDISTLETPPKNRLPVETYVVECTDALIKDACMREVARGGQVFILYNRVQSIERFHQEVQDLLGADVTVTYAHGQMEEGVLSRKIADFYEKKSDVLIATTIIENGIDIPDANTLIVIDSDRLGLAELYQIRGRVGRSTTLAYAYFTVREGKVLTENAVKRLDALLRYNELGSGFKIAMQDLEIRGAGNILGKEQHGNMEKVGYDMYCKLLKECVNELQGKSVTKEKEVEVTVSGDLAVPKDYIKEGAKRVEFYKKVALITDYAEFNDFIAEMRDIYGALPKSVENLINVGLIKNLARKIGVQRVVATDEGIGLHFHDGAVYGNEGVFKAIAEFNKACVLSPQSPPVIIFDNRNKSVNDRLCLLRNFLVTATSCG